MRAEIGVLIRTLGASLFACFLCHHSSSKEVGWRESGAGWVEIASCFANSRAEILRRYYFCFFTLARRSFAQPSLLACGALPIANASSGTSSVTQVAAAT